MNTIPLNVLLDAIAAMKVLRDAADEKLTAKQYVECLSAYSALKANVEYVAKQIKIEVQA